MSKRKRSAEDFEEIGYEFGPKSRTLIGCKFCWTFPVVEQFFKEKPRKPSIQVPVADGEWYVGVFPDAKRKK